MKAAILVQQNAPLELADVEIPELDIGQVLVKVAYSSICGKQVEEISGNRGEDPFLPHLLGHEGAGVVVDVGPGVRKVKSGDHVNLHWMKGTGIDSAPPRFTRNGETVSAGWVTTFSEYTIASENRVTLIPPDLGFDVAALLGCCVTTGLGIVFNDADLKPGQSIAVFGVGGIGFNVVQGAALVNAFPIVAIDLNDDKLKRVVALGATHALNGRHSDVEVTLMQLSGGAGFDVTVESTGNTDVFHTAYKTTSAAGKTIMAGSHNHLRPVTLDAYPLHFGRRIVGSHGGDTQPEVDIPRYISLYRQGKLKLDEQITHRYPLDRINEALDMVRSGNAGKCVIVMS